MECSKIKIDRDYKMMIAILEYCYFENQSKCTGDVSNAFDYLGALLGSLSVDIWDDKLPADIGNYKIWSESAASVKENDIIKKTVCFLENFMAQFEFSMQPVVSFVKTLSPEKLKQLEQNIL